MEDNPQCFIMSNGSEAIGSAPPINGNSFFSVFFEITDDVDRDALQRMATNIKCVSPWVQLFVTGDIFEFRIPLIGCSRSYLRNNIDTYLYTMRVLLQQIFREAEKKSIPTPLPLKKASKK